MKKISGLEVIFWSIAFPGFGHLVAGYYLKGIFFVLLEFLINVQSGFNQAIRYSFLGEMDLAFHAIDYQWLMFYPCVYMFALWDSYRLVSENIEKYSFFPYVFGAYFLTVGTMIATGVKFGDISLGPVFFPMISLIPGILTGYLIKVAVDRKKQKKSP